MASGWAAQDTTWDELATMSPREVRAQGLLPEGFQAAAARQAGDRRTSVSERADRPDPALGRNLRRFDVEMDLPVHLDGVRRRSF